MQKTIWASAVAAAALTFGSEARAQANLHSGDVLRPGDNMIYGELGWPDAAFGWQHGISDKVDIGIRASLIYGFEYTTPTPAPLGLGFRVPIRITPLKREKVSLQIHFDPGLKFDSFGSGVGVAACVQVNAAGQCTQYASTGYYGDLGGAGLRFGLWLYTGLEVGIHITRDVTISPGLDIPIYINLTNGTYGAIPLLFGAAVQYNINDSMSVGGTLKLGPSILADSAYTGCSGVVAAGVVVNCGPATPLGLIANAFFSYRL